MGLLVLLANATNISPTPPTPTLSANAANTQLAHIFVSRLDQKAWSIQV